MFGLFQKRQKQKTDLEVATENLLKGLFALVLAGAMAATPTTAAQTGSNYYPAVGYVTSQENDLVSVELASGEIFQFFADPGDYEKGDLCAMIIDSNGTTEVYDDIIIDAVNASIAK